MAAVVQVAGNNDFGSTISTPAFGAGVTNGNDVLILTQENDGTESVSSVTDNQSGVYSLLGTATAGSSEFKLWRRQSVANAPTTFSATATGGILFSIFAFETEPTGSYVGSNTTTATGTTPSLSITVAGTEALLLGYMALDGDSTASGSGGSSVAQPHEFGSAPGTPGTSYSWALYRETAASGSQSLALTLGTNRGRDYAAFAVENGGGGAAPTPTLMMLGVGS
jgi:hypothetical protein